MWRIYTALAGISALLLFGSGYAVGRNGEAIRFKEYRVKIEATQQALLAENERIRRQYDKISANANAGFVQAEAAHAAGAGRIRVRQCPGGGAKVPAAAHVAGEPGAASAERRLDSERDEALSVSAERCEEIANRAVMDAAQVLHLQAFYNGIRAAYGVEEYP
jgi:hypothetical protein